MIGEKPRLMTDCCASSADTRAEDSSPETDIGRTTGSELPASSRRWRGGMLLLGGGVLAAAGLQQLGKAKKADQPGQAGDGEPAAEAR